MKTLEETTRPLRTTPQRAQIIRQVEEVCQELNIPIEVDLRCFTYAELVLVHVRLQLGQCLSRQ